MFILGVYPLHSICHILNTLKMRFSFTHDLPYPDNAYVADNQSLSDIIEASSEEDSYGNTRGQLEALRVQVRVTGQVMEVLLQKLYEASLISEDEIKEMINSQIMTIMDDKTDEELANLAKNKIVHKNWKLHG